MAKPPSLLSVDTWSNFFNQALDFQNWLKDPSQISARAGAQLQNLGDTSHELEAEKINAIKQKTSKGFKFQDVNPNYLDRVNYYCVYDDPTLFRMIGVDSTFENSAMKYDNTGSPVNGQRVQSAYFRTLQIPVEGDWVKIEYLPVRHNTIPQGTFSSSENPFIPPTVEPQNTDEANNTFTSSATFSSDSPILLEFENPRGQAHIVRNGDAIETYFTNLILTFKQNSPPFRVTVGFNSRVHSAPDTKPTSLHLWKGPGLLKEGAVDVRAWQISDVDLSGTTGGYAFSGSELRLPIVTNEFDVGLGIHIGWITEFSADCVENYSPSQSANAMMNVELIIGYGGFGSSFIRYLERLAYLTLSTGGGKTADKARLILAEPIRYQLREGENLFVRMVAGFSLDNVNVKFSVSGYSVGRLEGVLPGGAIVQTLTPTTYLTENPYPSDLERYGCPKG